MEEKREIKKERSLGVALLGTYLVLNGLVVFIILIMSLFKPVRFAYLMVEEGLLGIRTFIWGIVSLVVGWNILKFREWARKTIVIASPIFLCSLLLGIAFQKISLGPRVIDLTMLIALIYFFTRPLVKKQFKNK